MILINPEKDVQCHFSVFLFSVRKKACLCNCSLFLFPCSFCSKYHHISTFS